MKNFDENSASKPLRLIFAGTPDFAADVLAILASTPHEIVAVYTQPDRPAGRGRHPQPSAVKQWAETATLPVYQPINFKSDDAIETLASHQADLMVVAAYGLLLPRKVLSTPRLGCLNVHVSLLPRWRGAAPIQRAIAAGDQETGVSFMQMDEGLDTGPLWHTCTCPITKADTSNDVYHKLIQLTQTHLPALLDQLASDFPPVPTPQPTAGATYAKKIKKEEARINWQHSAETIHCQIRAFQPWPIAFTTVQGQTLRIYEAEVKHDQYTLRPGEVLSFSKESLKVATSDGILCIKKAQLPNKRAMFIDDLYNGHAALFPPGACLGD